MKKKTIIIFIFTLILTSSFSQTNPYHFDSLPISTKFEFVGEVDLHVSDTKTELYIASIDLETQFTYMITQGVPDCLVTSNQFDGLDLYKKTEKGGYNRIIHIRKVGEIFKVFYVNQKNENGKLIISANISDGHNSITAMNTAYTLFWNNIGK